MLNKMLRATISKLKKVCIESFSPRIFRGDYYIPGKFQKFSATTLSRAHKSTDSGKGSNDDDEKCKKLIDEIFNSKPDSFLDPTTDLSNVQELKKEQVSQIISPPEAQCQVCERLIAQAFGKDGDDNKLSNDAIVSATTAKQTEEQLAQKVEAIDETPLVEAEKPKIEGFNVNPKVLGAEENVRLDTLNFDKCEGKDGVPATTIDEKANNELEELCQKVEKGNKFYHAGKDLYKMPEFNPYAKRHPIDQTYAGMTCVNHPYDDIAKRCINFPPNKIDRHILRELQRLGVPHSGGYASNTDNIGNEDDLSRQINNFNIQRGNHGDSPPDSQALNPPYENEQLKVERPMIYEQDKKPLPLCMTEQHVIDDTIMTLAAVGPKPGFNPNRMLLDPFDKKSLCYDCVDPEYDVPSYDKIHILVQRLENKNFIEQNIQGEQTQFAEHTQTYVNPYYQNYEIKPLHESPRLPERPVNACNENFTIHPSNREQPYSLEPFHDSEQRYNEMNFQENMVPKLNNQEHQHQDHQHQEHQHQENNYQVNTPMDVQNQQQHFWNRGYQNNNNYYRFQGGAQNHPTTPEEGPQIVNLPHGQQPYAHSASVHVFTNAAADRSETPETVETVLPHKENTAEEVAEHIKQQTSKQVGNISDENIAPGSAEEPKTSQQLNFGEQNPAQQVQYFQSTEPATEQKHLGRPIDPVHLSINDHYDLYDLRRESIGPAKPHGTVKVHQEQLDIKEQKQPNEEAHILGSVKVHSEQIDKKEEPIEKVQILGSVKAHPEQLDKKEQPIEQAQILGSVKAQSEQLDKKEQPAEQAQILGSVKAQSEQLDKKEQPAEQAQILGSAKVNSQQLDKKEQPIEQTQILGSVKAQSEQLDKKEQPAEQAQILGSAKVNSQQLDKKEQPIEQTQILESVKVPSEQLDKKEQPAEQAQILGSAKVNSEQLDKKEQPAEQAQILGSVTVPSEQLDKKEQPAEQAQILGSAKVNSEQLDKKEQPAEQAQILGSVKAQSEQLEKKEQPIEQAQILGSVKVNSEQLDKKEQPIEQTQVLGSVKVNSEQLDKKEQPIEQTQILESVKVPSEQLDKKEQPAEQAQILGSAKVNSEQLEKKEQPIEQAQILGSVKVTSEQLDKKEQSIKQTQVLGSVEAHLEPQKRPIDNVKVLSASKAQEDQLDLKKQPIEQLKILSSVKADPEKLYKKEQPIEQAQILGSVKADLEPQKRPVEHIKVLNATKAQEKQIHLTKPPTDQPKVLGANVVFGSVKADQEQVTDKNEGPIRLDKLIAPLNARQERLELKKQAIENLRILETAKACTEKQEKKEQLIEHVKLLSSVKPQHIDDVKEQTITEQPKIFSSLNIQEAPEEKAESIQEESKPKETNDKFEEKLSSTLIPLPKLNTDEILPLSVLLKRLREKSKIETCQDLIEPVGRKCSDKSPPCPPPAPTCPPPKPCPPPPCPPPPPPCPKPCKPACPNPCGPPKPACPPKPPCCSKYIQVDTDFDVAAILRETDVYLKKQMYETVTAILTKEVVMQLEKMGVSLLITYPNEIKDLGNVVDAETTAENSTRNEAACQVNATGVDLAKDYEPWVPIPSWPIPRKVKKRPLVCPKDGCKIIPPPRLNPPCSQNPCLGFPKRKNSFSTPDSDLTDLSENVSVRYAN